MFVYFVDTSAYGDVGLYEDIAGIVPALYVNTATSQGGSTPSTGIKLDNTSMFVSAGILFTSLIALGFVISKRKMFN